MGNVFNIAKKLCEANSWGASNLKLQKTLYLSQLLSIGKRQKTLFDAGFEAWMYGPVCPQVYNEFKIFGSKPVEEWAFLNIKNITNLEEENEFIKWTINLLKEKTPFNLVALTHRKGTAWDKRFVPGLKNTITEHDMLEEYNRFWTDKQ
jgi:uncharacterized phage-associated protein